MIFRGQQFGERQRGDPPPRISTSDRPARPTLSKLLLMATDGIVASLYDGVIPGLATHEIVERRLAREDTCESYVNCWVAADGARLFATKPGGVRGKRRGRPAL